jgi:hypothetical protein
MTPNVPDNGLGQMEEAQTALREGLERARMLVREARIAMRERGIAEPAPPTRWRAERSPG